LEGLEDRLLLYAATGGRWTYGSRITFSFVPDGTNFGGVPSSLYSTLNANYSTATWQGIFQKAAAVWQSVANINMVMVSDNGANLGTVGLQQGSPNIGDIRIGAISLPSGTLGTTFLPPPNNGGTLAGDIVMNASANWNPNSGYDLLTVAIHEFGHALGLGHSAIASADMYAYYNGIKQTATSDDIAGMQSIYGARPADMFDAVASNNAYMTASDLTPYIDSKGQINLPYLDRSTTNDSDWYFVRVPASTNGTMKITVQSTNLSLLAPGLVVMDTSLYGLAAISSTNYGATLSVIGYGVSPGEGYYFRISSPVNGAGGVGRYGLQLNFGSQAQPPFAPPNTTVYEQPDSGGPGGMGLETSDAFTVLPSNSTTSSTPAVDNSRTLPADLLGALWDFSPITAQTPTSASSSSHAVSTTADFSGQTAIGLDYAGPSIFQAMESPASRWKSRFWLN
jgi:hypothetical protein